jgi:uncharacterized protein YjbI with pentapeptide repeats
MGERTVNEDRVYSKIGPEGNPLPKGDFEGCSFSGCDLSGTDLSGIRFTGCRFEGCNLSMTTLKATVFNGAVFVDCKMLGLRFEDCHRIPFIVGFENCILDFCTFTGMSLRKTSFRACHVREADFSEADLTEAVFSECRLPRSLFNRTNLEKADFRNSLEFDIDPSANRMRRAKFSADGLRGLLGRYDLEID